MGKIRILLFVILGFGLAFALNLGCGGGGGGDSELAGNPNYVGSLSLPPNMAPYGLAYDGTHFWFENQDVIYEMGQDSSILSSFSTSPYAGNRGMTWDDTSSGLWALFTDCSGYTMFIQYDNTGAILDSMFYTDITGGSVLYCASGLGFFDSVLVTKTGNKIRLIDAAARSVRAGSIPCPVSSANRIAFAGSDLWVSDDFRVEVKFFHLDAFGSVGPIGSIIDSVQGQGADAQGLTWDGTSLWTVTWNSPPGFHAWDVY